MFLSLTAPHHPVTAKTLARWLLEVLTMAGVDTTRFKAHSIRGAAAALWHEHGLSLSQICKKADWSTQSGVYQSFYRRYIDN